MTQKLEMVMRRYGFNDLVIEVTRKCNMSCAHCLRGDAEDESMTFEMVDKILERVKYIGTLTFTGGEPLLNPQVMVYFMDEVMSRSIPVGSFFMATNGSLFDRELLFKFMEFYHYVDEQECSSVAISYDNYHYDTNELAEKWWKSVVFYSDVKDMSQSYNSSRLLVDEGYANDNGLGGNPLNITDNVYVEGGAFEEIICINYKGEIYNNCDMSYETQDENTLGTILGIDKLYSNGVES